MIGEHVGKLLSGYIDGELTQQQRQRVEVHCSDCAECERELEALASLRREIGVSELSQFGEDTWRETMADTTTKAARGIGWLLLIGGAMAAAGVAVFAFLTDPSIELRAKLIAGAIYGGLAFLFISVLRQRLIERKTDKYKDVEI
jgi:anti-sigma factor RsiW